MAKNIDFMGAVFPDVPSVKLPQQGGGLVAFDDTTDATATADKILQGYTAYANGQKLVGTASGGITPSGTIQITQNGQVDVTQYAIADVNVSGGGGSSYTLLKSDEITITSDTATNTNFEIECGSEAYTSAEMIYVKVRSKNGKRAGYHYGTDSYASNANVANGTRYSLSTGNKVTINYRVIAGGGWETYSSMSNTGLYLYKLTSAGVLTIRYSKGVSSVGTIDGDYTVEVYKLKYPNDESPFDA